MYGMQSHQQGVRVLSGGGGGGGGEEQGNLLPCNVVYIIVLPLTIITFL